MRLSLFRRADPFILFLGVVCLLAFGFAVHSAALGDSGDPGLASHPFALQEPYAGFTLAGKPTATPTAVPCGSVTLYDQSDFAGNAFIVSQNYEPQRDNNDNMAADDFVVPNGDMWVVNRIVVEGRYSFNGGPADSFNLAFYTDSLDLPVSLVPNGNFESLAYSVLGDNFSFDLPSELMLGPGRYWVSVQANMDFVPHGDWEWQDRIALSNAGAVWQNPLGGFGRCQTWSLRGPVCRFAPGVPDQSFSIMGYRPGCPSSTPTPIPTPGYTMEVLPPLLDVCLFGTGIYTVNTTSIQGFSEPIFLSQFNAPGNVTFSPNPVIPGQSSTMSVGTPNHGGNWDIYVHSVAGTQTANKVVILYSLPGGAPLVNLVAPSDGALFQSVTPRFEWAYFGIARSFRIDIATDPAFANIIHTASELVAATYQGAVLQPATTYYWRITGTNGCSSATTQPFAFTTADTTPTPTSTPTGSPSPTPSMGSVTVDTTPAGRFFSVDSVIYSTRQTFNWEVGSTHTLSVKTPQDLTLDIRYDWNSWSDGGEATHSILVGESATYIADFGTQYKLTMCCTGPSGTVLPPTGFYDAGESVLIRAIPGTSFWRWFGTGAGSYNGSSLSATVVMNNPITQTAAFEGGPPTQTPTNTPTATPTGTHTPTPTATPTATPFCERRIRYSGPALPIPDNQEAGVDITKTVDGIGVITALEVDFTGGDFSPDPTSTQVPVNHSWVGDLRFTLTSPAGTSVTFLDRPGVPASVYGCPSNNIDFLLFGERFTRSVEDHCPGDSAFGPFNGAFKPSSPLSVFSGENANGTWTLNVADLAALDTGSIRRFDLLFLDPCMTPTPTATPTHTPTATPTLSPTPTPGPSPSPTQNPFIGFVNINTNVPGLQFTVDGVTYFGSHTFEWWIGDTHTLSTTSPQGGEPGTRYLWNSWSDGGALTHNVGATNQFTVITGDFTTQYHLNMLPGAGSTITPQSGFFNAGQSVEIAAIEGPGCHFVRWIGTGSGSYSGTANPATVVMNARITQGNEIFCEPPSAQTVAFDYDLDRRSDISVFRPSDGNWYLDRSSEGFATVHFGVSTDRIAPADYDGDGRTDIAVYRPSTGIWYISNSASGTFSYYGFGIAEDLPVPADYDGDGKADICVFRPSTGTWYRQNSGNGEFVAVQFGADGDRPTVGDFDGDGKSDIAVFRPSEGAWYQINSSNGSFFGEQFGISTDKIVPADYDGDGKTDIAIYRPSEGLWYIKNSATATYTPYVFGLAEDIPVPGDYDGDGKADIAVFRTSDGTWYIVNSQNGSFTIYQFGQSGDRPTQSAFGIN